MAQDPPPVDTIIQDVQSIKLGSVEGDVKEENRGGSDDSDAEGVDGTEPGGSTPANKKKKKKKPKKKVSTHYSRPLTGLVVDNV
jgi:hypothetical protein